MKKSLIILMLFSSLFSFSQTRTILGQIKDITTMLPIEAVSVSVEGSNNGCVTNDEGKFRLSFPIQLNKLNFSHLNYYTYSYVLKANETVVEIFLESKSFTLDEVILSNVPAKSLLKNAVDNSKKKLEKSILLNTYYREFVKVDDKYTNFSDGLLNYNVKRKSGASDLYVEQSRAFKLNDENTAERDKTTEAIYFYDVRDAVADAYNFKKINMLLGSELYEYESNIKKDKNGNSITVVTILPKENVELGLYMGTVVFDTKTKLILEIDLKKSPEHKQYIPEVNAIFFHFKVNEEARKSSFKIDGDKYILVYNQNKINIYIRMKNKFNNTYEFMSDLITNDYKEGEFDLDRSKRHKERSLFAAGNNYTTEYWNTSNIILLNQEEEEVIKTLK